MRNYIAFDNVELNTQKMKFSFVNHLWEWVKENI